MKQLLLIIALITLFASNLKAQNRATTVEEYNYIISGQYNTILPGHVLKKSNVSVQLEFMDVSREVIIYEFYRGYSGNPCALALVYKRVGEQGATCICVPDIDSGPDLWAAYNKKLNSLNDTGSALQTISYALGMYAASH